VPDGFLNAGIYFWVTMAGTYFGAYTLVGFGWESFEVPKPTLSEQWPFESLTNTKLGMWTFIGSDIILFGAFIGSYMFMRLQYGWQGWFKAAAYTHKPVWPGLMNTYLLLASSFTIVLALVYAKRQNKLATLGFLGLTLAGAGAFLVNKAIEWHDLYFNQGWTLASDPMGSTYYLTTGLHAAHVIVGMMILLFLIARAYKGAYMGEEESHTIEYFGLYWHFVDIVWLFLFPLFYIL
jgi:cytochrome c oxidase subunit I+III